VMHLVDRTTSRVLRHQGRSNIAGDDVLPCERAYQRSLWWRFREIESFDGGERAGSAANGLVSSMEDRIRY
jgi:hypothetical protein